MKKSIMFIQRSLVLVSVFCLVGMAVSAKLSTNNFKSDEIITLGDDIKTVKIKGPSYKMFKKADLEIHQNMYKEINAVFELKISENAKEIADLEISKLFFEEHFLNIEDLSFEAADIAISQKFFLEH